MIEWLDSAQPISKWQYLSEYVPTKPVNCVSVGFLIHNGKDVKALAPNMGEIDDKTSIQASGIIHIPTCSITKITALEEEGTTNKRKENLLDDLKNKEYRDAFVSELIDTGIPFQIHALREQRGWTQKELGQHVEMAQERISLLEDPNYGKLSLSTLKRLASAFDIGLIVRFVPFSELVDLELHLTPDSLKASSFEEVKKREKSNNHQGNL